MGCGHSSNTRAKLLALWALLFFAKEIGILSLHVYGDSSVIINWANDKATLSALDLDGWCDNIVEPKAYFHTLDFHVFREHNQRAHSVSRKALAMVAGLLSFNDYYVEINIREDKLQLF